MTKTCPQCKRIFNEVNFCVDDATMLVNSEDLSYVWHIEGLLAENPDTKPVGDKEPNCMDYLDMLPIEIRNRIGIQKLEDITAWCKDINTATNEEIFSLWDNDPLNEKPIYYKKAATFDSTNTQTEDEAKKPNVSTQPRFLQGITTKLSPPSSTSKIEKTASCNVKFLDTKEDTLFHNPSNTEGLDLLVSLNTQTEESDEVTTTPLPGTAPLPDRKTSAASTLSEVLLPTNPKVKETSSSSTRSASHIQKEVVTTDFNNIAQSLILSSLNQTSQITDPIKNDPTVPSPKGSAKVDKAVNKIAVLMICALLLIVFIGVIEKKLDQILAHKEEQIRKLEKQLEQQQQDNEDIYWEIDSMKKQGNLEKNFASSIPNDQNFLESIEKQNLIREKQKTNDSKALIPKEKVLNKPNTKGLKHGKSVREEEMVSRSLEQVSFAIFNADGHPLPQARVHIYKRITISSDKGEVKFIQIPCGTSSLMIETKDLNYRSQITLPCDKDVVRLPAIVCK